MGCQLRSYNERRRSRQDKAKAAKEPRKGQRTNVGDPNKSASSGGKKKPSREKRD